MAVSWDPMRPRLRPLDVFRHREAGKDYLAFRDPAGFTDEVALLPLALLDVVSLFDGEHSLPEIRSIVEARHGSAPAMDQIQGLLDRLDGVGLLDSPRFAERRRAVEDAFLAAPTRRAAHAGTAYPSDPRALREQIHGFFEHAEGPGAPDGSRPDAGTGPALRGLIAPHIDFHRGGPTYAWAYRELAERSDSDLFIILGTSHAGLDAPFAITLKTYETPLGPAEVDHAFVQDLGRRYGHDLLAGEAAHRSEHSIEFQAVMLRYLFGDRRPFTIVPVLASFLHEALETRGDPERDPRVPRFVEALLGSMATSARSVCLIAGVDLAHVGPRFGDAEPNTETSLRSVEQGDHAMLESVTEGDPTGFFTSVASGGDPRRICGSSPIYVLLRALPGVRGRLLRYAMWRDREGAVSFCAAAFP